MWQREKKKQAGKVYMVCAEQKVCRCKAEAGSGDRHAGSRQARQVRADGKGREVAKRQARKSSIEKAEVCTGEGRARRQV